VASLVYSRQDGGTGRSVTMTSISNTLKETINPRLIFLAKFFKQSIKRKRKCFIQIFIACEAKDISKIITGMLYIRTS
jgi:hypothetical protein